MKLVKYVLIFISITSLFNCNLKDDLLYKKVIITSDYKVEWYTKSGLTNVYPEYLKITHRKNETSAILEEPEIDDINLLLGDTLKIAYGRHYDLKYLNKKDTIINGLLITYEPSKLSYNSTIKNNTFKKYW